MSQNPNIFTSVLKIKCPKCHEGNLFCNKKIYQYKHFFDMPDNCPKCNQDFQIETGFYLGAMFISYAIAILLNIVLFVVFLVFDAYTIGSFLITAGFLLLLISPYLIKVSRSIWIALSVKYDPNIFNNNEA